MDLNTRVCYGYNSMDLRPYIWIQIHVTGFFLPFHRWYVAVYEQALEKKCGYTGVSPYWNWTIGERSENALSRHALTRRHLASCIADSGGVFDSDFFKDADPESGLGGWGDSTKDFSVTDGAFSDFMNAYPNPHILRRNFSLQPWADLGDLSGFNPYPDEYANATFTYEAISELINGFVGDFVGFQKLFEQTQGAHGTPFEVCVIHCTRLSVGIRGSPLDDGRRPRWNVP